MSEPFISACKSIILTSTTPGVTAAFYRDVLGIPLEEEQHRGTARHWACQLGGIHLAIHQADGFWLPSEGGTGPATVVSFTVDDIESARGRLAEHGVPVLAQDRIGPMSFVAVRDPDGRHVCLGTPWPASKSGAA